MPSDGSSVELRDQCLEVLQHRSTARAFTLNQKESASSRELTHACDSECHATGWKVKSSSVAVIQSIRCRCFILPFSVHFTEQDINRSQRYSRIQSPERAQEGNLKPWNVEKNTMQTPFSVSKTTPDMKCTDTHVLTVTR